MLSRNKILAIVPLLILALSCTKVHNEPCDPITDPQPDSTTCSFWQDAIGISAITGPTTAYLGQTIQFSVTATGRNGCAQQAQVMALPFGNDISLSGNIFYQGCICTQALVDLNTTYTFTPSQTGIYTFHAMAYDGTPLTHTLTVQ
jgi:hypothetical protein